jgi:hypothetical protein
MRNVYRVAGILALFLTLLDLGDFAVSAQGPTSQDSPLAAITVGNPLPRIPPHAAQWIRFDYSFTPDQIPPSQGGRPLVEWRRDRAEL